MAYFMDLFSPETYEAFNASDRSVSGFRPRQKQTSHLSDTVMGEYAEEAE